jgi:hypothetical protein
MAALAGADQLSFEQKQVIILGVLHVLLFLGSMFSLHGSSPGRETATSP